MATGHSLAEAPARISDISLTHGRALAWGNIAVLLRYADVASTGTKTAGRWFQGIVDVALRTPLSNVLTGNPQSL